MSGRLAVSATPERALLVAPPGALLTHSGADLCVAFEDAPAAPGAVCIRWLERAPSGGLDGDSGERVIAPAGDGAWRHSLLPAADVLFDLPAPGPHAGVLVAGGSAERREELCAAIARRGLPHESASTLTREGLEAAAVVVLLPPDDGHTTLPAIAPAVLAARRLLLAPAGVTDFGLPAGVCHLSFSEPGECADIIESAHRLPYAYLSIRAWAAHAAKRYRASAL